jgi:hypothetical protein
MVNPIEIADISLPSTVLLGGLAKIELLATVRDQGILLNQAAEDLFVHCCFNPSDQAKRISIAALSVFDLGFPEGATYSQLTTCALEYGLVECPLELGPYLRLQFLNQPEVPDGQQSGLKGAPTGALTIMSKPLDQTDAAPKGFYLRRMDGSLWLRGYWADSSHFWSPTDVLVFARNEKASG